MVMSFLSLFFLQGKKKLLQKKKIVTIKVMNVSGCLFFQVKDAIKSAPLPRPTSQPSVPLR